MKNKELLENKEFIEILANNINKSYHSYLNRGNAPAGYKYKRNIFDRLGGNFNADFVLKNIVDIREKKSNLSSEIRAVVNYFFDTAFLQYLRKDENK